MHVIGETVSYIVYVRILAGMYYVGHASGTGTPEEIMNSRAGVDGKRYSLNPRFVKAIKKYGWKNVISKVLAYDLTEEEDRNYETYFIMYYNADNPEFGYNCNKGEGDQKWAHAKLNGETGLFDDPMDGRVNKSNHENSRMTNQAFVDYIIKNQIKGIKRVTQEAKRFGIVMSSLNHYRYEKSDPQGNRFNLKFKRLCEYVEKGDDGDTLF